MITGIDLTIPLIATIIIVGSLLNVVTNAVQPIVDVARAMLDVGREAPESLVQAVALLSIFAGPTPSWGSC